jgi:sensor histidine kinase YesM
VNQEPFGITTFCDDIRYEVNGKMTLVGCYLSGLNFTGPPPGMLPTFAALVSLRIPLLFKFNSIKIRVTKEESEEISDIFMREIEAPDETNKIPFRGWDKVKTEDRVLMVETPIHWQSYSFSESCLLRVRAYFDDDMEIRLGGLSINFPYDEDNRQES